MRKAPKSQQEKKEILEADRRTKRTKGFALMSVRDQGYARLRDYNQGESVTMDWNIPGENKFLLHLESNSKHDEINLVFDAEEFRKWLRWA